MKYSLMLTTVREFEDLEPLFRVSSSDAEVIIIDPKYKERTRKMLGELEHDYCRVVYAPKMEMGDYVKDDYSVYKFKNDKMRCHNTGFAYCEGEWVFKLDDDTELCPNFFGILDKTIDVLSKEFGDTRFVVRPVKLEAWSGHQKWDYPVLKQLGLQDKGRYLSVGRDGISGTLFITLDQFIATRDSIDKINGMDERYDIGHGSDDMDCFQRYHSLGHKIVIDRELMTYQKGHVRKIDPIPFAEWLYDMELFEIFNGRYYAYSQFKLKDIRVKLLENKRQYEVRREASPGGSMASEIGENPKHFSGEYPFDKIFTKDEIEENQRRILTLKDRHKGGDLFILGNSPDITREFIEKIRGKITFAANGFIVMKDKWGYEPTYMVVSNQGTFDNHLRNMIPEFKEYEGGSVSDLFWTAKTAEFVMSDLVLKPVLLGLPHLRTKERIDFMRKHVHIRVLNRSEYEDKFEILHETPDPDGICFDLSKGTYLVGTVVTDLMLPLAVWMGFKNIYLKGCSGGAGHFYDTSPRHFWDADKQRHMYEDVYAVFKKLLDERGIDIYNLDRPTSNDIAVESESRLVHNPTRYDGHLWDGPVMHHVLGKEPYVIGHKSVDEAL